MITQQFSFPPKSGEQVILRITNRPFLRRNVESGKTKCVVLVQLYKIEPIPEDGTGRVVELTKDIYMGMIVELRKNNIYIDKSLECLKRVWTITGIEWKEETICKVTLRTDLI